MKRSIWPLRLLILIYVFYKMVLSSSTNLITVDFENGDKTNMAGEITGSLLILFLLLFLFGLFFFYQIRQVLVEVMKTTRPVNSKFRLYSIVFSSIFFALCSVSLFNVSILRTELMEYLLELYTVFTFISVVASTIVIVKDIKLLKLDKHQRDFRIVQRSSLDLK